MAWSELFYGGEFLTPVLENTTCSFANDFAHPVSYFLYFTLLPVASEVSELLLEVYQSLSGNSHRKELFHLLVRSDGVTSRDTLKQALMLSVFKI